MKYLQILARAVTEHEQQLRERGLDRKQMEDVKIKKIFNRNTWQQFNDAITLVTLSRLPLNNSSFQITGEFWFHWSHLGICHWFQQRNARNHYLCVTWLLPTCKDDNKRVFGLDTSKKYHHYATSQVLHCPSFSFKLLESLQNICICTRYPAKCPQTPILEEFRESFWQNKATQLQKRDQIAFVTYQPGNIAEFLGKMK